MARIKTYSKSELHISGLKVDVLRKNVKNLNLKVYPKERNIRVSVPRRVQDKAIIQFIKDKLPWIKKHLENYREKPHKASLKYISGEIHLFLGKEYRMQVIEKEEPPSVYIINEDQLTLQVRPGTDVSKRAAIIKEWYRAELKKEIPKLIQKWEKPMGVSVNEFGVKLMKTRWGTCNIRDKRIWLNLELAKNRPELLEYVVIHEMVHLLERLHSKRFYAFMSQFLPDWKALKMELNGISSIQDC
ncbi:MAG: SprT family zinc-dependent metalloprotease [Gracilimonas sp.]